MKVYLIKASAKGAYKEYKRSMGGPPQNIFAAAAATPDHIEAEMCDETIDMKVNLRTRADVVALFFSTPDAVHAYAMADKFRSKGKTAVLAGLHASFLPEEASGHGDSVLIGELEGIWEQLLQDVADNCLKPVYQRTTPFSLEELKPYPTHLIPPERYDEVWTVTVSRGCPYKCGFCTVPGFFKGQRYRPVQDVIDEIKNCGTRYIELHADNLLVNRKYVVELFEALIPLNIEWQGETSINLAKDEELLAMAARSGLRYVLVGLETPSASALKETGKGFVKTSQVKERIELFNKYGIKVDSSFIFGFDEHDKGIFQQTYDYCLEIGIQSIHSVLLIPFPGTPVYKKLNEANRLLTRDWSKYDGVHAVFQPEQMTTSELESGALWFHERVGRLQKKGKLVRQPSTSKKPDSGDEEKIKISQTKHSATESLLAALSHYRWKTILTLVVLIIATLYNFMPAWGALFLFWAGVNIKKKETYLVERILRSENPILYWLLVSGWISLGLMTLFT